MEKVLFTRKLTLPELIWSFLNGYIPVVKPMIKIVSVSLTAQQKSLLKTAQYDYFVFSSKNAVKYFNRQYRTLRFRKSFKKVEFIAIGQQTAKALKRYGNPIHLYQFNNADNFEQYVQNKVGSANYIYFCSDLAAVKWKLHQHRNGTIIELYKTKADSKSVQLNRFKHLVFMSSSAVNSFFQKNIQIPKHTLCYAIGETTRNTLRYYHNGPIFKPNRLSFYSIISNIKNKK